MKAPAVGIILGGTLWSRGGGGWVSSALVERDVAGLCTDRSGRAELLLIYEPEGMAHERIPGYYRSRAEFSESLRNRERFPVIERAEGAWAIDSLNFDSAVPAETFFHSELKPGLRSLWEDCERKGIALVGAWSLFSVLANLRARRPGGEAASAILVVAGEYIAVAFCDGEGGPGLFRRWLGEPSEQTWRAVIICLRELRVGVELPSGAPGAQDGRRLRIYAEGPTLESCPRWGEWQQAGSVRVAGLDRLAEEVVLSRRSTAPNLIRSFPRPVDVPRLLRAVGAVAVLVLVGAVGSGLDSWRQIHAERARIAEVQREQASLERSLSSNRAVAAQIEARPSLRAASTLATVDRLCAALPVNACLSYLHFAPSGAVELAGPYVGASPGVSRIGDMLRSAGISAARADVVESTRWWHATGQLSTDSHEN